MPKQANIETLKKALTHFNAHNMDAYLGMYDKSVFSMDSHAA